MNDDELRTQLRRELDAAPAWPLDVDEAGRRAARHHRERTALTTVSVIVALGVTAVSLVALSSVRPAPRGDLGSVRSAAPGTTSPSAPPATTRPTSSTEARFTCDGSTTLPAEFTVAAGPAGVRITVDNTSGEAMGFEYDTGGADAPPGEHAVENPQGGTSWPLAPGDHHVKCLPDSVGEPDTVPAATLHVADPSGYWVSSELQCNSDHGFGSNIDWIEGAGWPTVNEAAHHALDDYAIRGDLIKRVGYPDENDLQFVLVRNGRNIVRTNLYRSGTQGNWVYSGAMGCGGEDRVKGGFHAPIRDR